MTADPHDAHPSLESPHGTRVDGDGRHHAIVEATRTAGDTMATETHDGPGPEPARDHASPQPSTPKPPREQGGWAADHVPLIMLALIVLVLGIAGAASNDSVTCPGGARSCGIP